MQAVEDMAHQWTSEELDRAGIPHNRTILSRPGCAAAPASTPSAPFVADEVLLDIGQAIPAAWGPRGPWAPDPDGWVKGFTLTAPITAQTIRASISMLEQFSIRGAPVSGWRVHVDFSPAAVHLDVWGKANG